MYLALTDNIDCSVFGCLDKLTRISEHFPAIISSGTDLLLLMIDMYKLIVKNLADASNKFGHIREAETVNKFFLN